MSDLAVRSGFFELTTEEVNAISGGYGPIVRGMIEAWRWANRNPDRAMGAANKAHDVWDAIQKALQAPEPPMQPYVWDAAYEPSDRYG